MKELILASNSPRRKELIGNLPYKFKITAKNTVEKLDGNLSPYENVMNLALYKATAVAKDYPDDFVIGCDTIVVLDEKILGKPKNEDDAKQMLRMLSGREHIVYTGVCIVCKALDTEHKFYEKTSVKMMEFTGGEIDDYVKTGEPLDKAGAYGIQEKGAKFIERINGDYFNVVGLPLNRLYKELKKVTGNGTVK